MNALHGRECRSSGPRTNGGEKSPRQRAERRGRNLRRHMGHLLNPDLTPSRPSEPRGTDRPRPGLSGARPAPGAARQVHAFSAELDIAELDGRGRPGAAWAGRACELSRSQVVFRSRRMCYQGRELVVAVHLIDDRPVCLFGKVTKCEYDGDALYRTIVAFETVPETDAIREWLAGLGTKP